jgi:hypothetical protein
MTCSEDEGGLDRDTVEYLNCSVFCDWLYYAWDTEYQDQTGGDCGSSWPHTFRCEEDCMEVAGDLSDNELRQLETCMACIDEVTDNTHGADFTLDDLDELYNDDCADECDSKGASEFFDEWEDFDHEVSLSCSCDGEPSSCSDIGSTADEQYFGCCYDDAVYWCVNGEFLSEECEDGLHCMISADEGGMWCEQ